MGQKSPNTEIVKFIANNPEKLREWQDCMKAWWDRNGETISARFAEIAKYFNDECSELNVSLKEIGKPAFKDIGCDELVTLFARLTGEDSNPLTLGQIVEEIIRWKERESARMHLLAGAQERLTNRKLREGAVPESIELTTADGLTQWAKLFDISPTTLKRRFKDGLIRHKKLSAKSYQIAVDDLPAKHQDKYRNAKN
jgi:hypothetical protein